MDYSREAKPKLYFLTAVPTRSHAHFYYSVGEPSQVVEPSLLGNKREVAPISIIESEYSSEAPLLLLDWGAEAKLKPLLLLVWSTSAILSPLTLLGWGTSAKSSKLILLGGVLTRSSNLYYCYYSVGTLARNRTHFYYSNEVLTRNHTHFHYSVWVLIQTMQNYLRYFLRRKSMFYYT